MVTFTDKTRGIIFQDVDANDFTLVFAGDHDD
jgi:hypothetical protein